MGEGFRLRLAVGEELCMRKVQTSADRAGQERHRTTGKMKANTSE
jgi:hypothetical protein